MATRSENCPGNHLESGRERSSRHQRSGHWRLRNPSDASPVKIHLGQVGLSSPHRQLNLCDSKAVTFNEPEYRSVASAFKTNQMLMAIVRGDGIVVARGTGGPLN